MAPIAKSPAVPPGGRLDEHKIDTLRVWGEGLQGDQREEVRAAGRAISILVEEIERLNIDLWHARAELLSEEEPKEAAPAPRFPRAAPAQPAY
jgi:hypothetical protein